MWMSEVKVTESTYNTELLMQNFKFNTKVLRPWHLIRMNWLGINNKYQKSEWTLFDLFKCCCMEHSWEIQKLKYEISNYVYWKYKRTIWGVSTKGFSFLQGRQEDRTLWHSRLHLYIHSALNYHEYKEWNYQRYLEQLKRVHSKYIAFISYYLQSTTQRE